MAQLTAERIGLAHMGQLRALFEAAEAAISDLRSYVGVDSSCDLDAQECFGLGATEILVGGVSDPRPWIDGCLISPDGDAIEVHPIRCGPPTQDFRGHRLFGYCDEEQELESPADHAAHAFVVVSGVSLLAVHLVAGGDIDRVARQLGEPLVSEEPEMGYVLDAWFHENVKMEPEVAFALGVRTWWFEDAAYSPAQPPAGVWQEALEKAGCALAEGEQDD